MTMSDTLGDLLTRIRNGQNAGLDVVKSPASKLRENVLEVLKKKDLSKAIRVLTMPAVWPIWKSS